MLMILILTKKTEVFKMTTIDSTYAITMLVGVLGCLVAQVILKIKEKKKRSKQ